MERTRFKTHGTSTRRTLSFFPLQCLVVFSYSSSLNKILAHTLVIFLEKGALYTNVKYKPNNQDEEK